MTPTEFTTSLENTLREQIVNRWAGQLRQIAKIQRWPTISRGVFSLFQLASLLSFLIPAAWGISSAPSPATRAVAMTNPADDWMTIAADFDGDHRLDQARLSMSKSGYEIDITFAQARPSLQIGWLNSIDATVQIVSCDVDLDGDQDLVATQVPSIFPLALWLGDGQGHFTPGDQATHSSLFSSPNAPFLECFDQTISRACIFRTMRPSFSLAEAVGLSKTPVAGSLETSLCRMALPQRPAQPLSSRGPPRVA